MLRYAGAGNPYAGGIGCSSQLKLSQMLEMLMDSIDRVIVVCHEGHLVGGDTTLPPNFPLRSIFFGSGAMFRIFSIS